MMDVLDSWGQGIPPGGGFGRARRTAARKTRHLPVPRDHRALPQPGRTCLFQYHL